MSNMYLEVECGTVAGLTGIVAVFVQHTPGKTVKDKKLIAAGFHVEMVDRWAVGANTAENPVAGDRILRVMIPVILMGNSAEKRNPEPAGKTI